MNESQTRRVKHAADPRSFSATRTKLRETSSETKGGRTITGGRRLVRASLSYMLPLHSSMAAWRQRGKAKVSEGQG
eukprot:139517-Hanusia_phi.AAC.2